MRLRGACVDGRWMEVLVCVCVCVCVCLCVCVLMIDG